MELAWFDCFFIRSKLRTTGLVWPLFIFHHSLTGWYNLKTNLKWSHLKCIQALPFNLGAILLYWLLFVKLENRLEVNAALF